MMMSSTPFYSLSGGGNYNKLSTKKRRKRATTKNKNKNVAASLFQRIQNIKFFSIEFYNSDKILSQKSNEVEKTMNTKKRHLGWSERCSVNIDDTSLTAETLVSPRPLLGDTDSALPLPDMNTLVTSNKASSADENDCWIDGFPRPQNCTSDDDTKSNNKLIWSDASLLNNHCCSEGTHHFSFDNIHLDSDTTGEFWTQEEHNTFRIEISPTNNSNHRHRKHTKRKEDADQISPVKLHAIAEKLSPRSVSSVDELPWTSYNIDNYSCSSTHHDGDTKNIAFPFNNKSLLTSMARDFSALSKRYYTLQQQAKKDDTDRRRRLEQIELLEGQLQRLLSGNGQGDDDDNSVITTITSDTAMSKFSAHHHCNNDGFSLDERERIISLETLLALKLAENEALATRAENLRQFLCHEDVANDVTSAQLPADVTDLDSLLTLNTSYKPHNYWICAGKPIIYCMRCDCQEAHTCYVGQTNEGELWPKVGGHFEDLWRKVQGRRSKKPKDSIMYLTKDFGESSFAKHVVRKHLYNVPSREAVREWGSDMIRITVVGADVQNAKVLVHDVLFSSSVSSEFIEIS
jgi:hypothetical protein